MTMTITDKGFAEAVKKLHSLNQLRAIRPDIKAATLYIKGEIAQYPPGTSANVPGPYPKKWYVRGYGPQWARAGGGWGGRRKSETLGRKWGIKMQDGGLTGVVGTNVSYARYVQDDELQARFHKSRGWRTVQDVAQKDGKVAIRIISAGIARVLAGR